MISISSLAIMPICLRNGAYVLSLYPYACASHRAPWRKWVFSSRFVAGVHGYFTHINNSKGISTLNGRPVRAEVQADESSSTTTHMTFEEKSEADRLVDGMSFGQLCDEFQCISSPAVEATARQLVRDILERREGNRALGSFAVFVEYKDPLRSFRGRDKYKRPSWIKTSLENASVAVQEMAMKSSSILNIKWVVRGRPKFLPAPFGSDLTLVINSTFILNQISGQVIEHAEEWDLSGSSALGQAFFWVSRLAYVTVENGRDAVDAIQAVSKLVPKGKDEDRSNIYADPAGDPNKFFQTDDNPQRDIYQVGLFLALLYLVVQFLRSTL